MKVLLGFNHGMEYVNFGGMLLEAVPVTFYPENIFMGFNRMSGRITARMWEGVGIEFGFKFLDSRQTCKVEG